MRATVIIDNIKNGGIPGEWGLCVLIEYRGKRILLDTGASALFAENAKALGLPLEEVDYAVLSHAHYDHANGMERFFQINDHAKFFLQEGCGENCYHKKWFFRRYIGLPKGVMADWPDRIQYASGQFRVCGGVSLIPHTSPGLDAIGKREHMYLRKGGGWVPDDFSHEQSLAFETSRGLVVFNSCSHGGAGNIIREVGAAFPGRKVLALIGGLHLYNKPEREVRELAGTFRDAGVELVYTGHCTGSRAYGILREELGGAVRQFHTGCVMEFED